MKDPRREMSFCNIRIHALTRHDLLQSIDHAHNSGEKLCILNHNLHSLYLFETDARFRKAYDSATIVYVDGMPVIWLARAAGLKISAAHRVTFLDSFDAILETAAAKKWRVFYLGSSEAVLQEGMRAAREKHPALILKGRNGFFDKSEAGSSEVIQQINEFRADILFVGMGMPNQELWLSSHLDRLQVTAALTSGATLDYTAGVAYKPPSWAGPLGLYGVFRLFSDPRRLWRRYLLEPLYLSVRLGPRLARGRGFPLSNPGS